MRNNTETVKVHWLWLIHTKRKRTRRPFRFQTVVSSDYFRSKIHIFRLKVCLHLTITYYMYMDRHMSKYDAGQGVIFAHCEIWSVLSHDIRVRYIRTNRLTAAPSGTGTFFFTFTWYFGRFPRIPCRTCCVLLPYLVSHWFRRCSR